MAMPVVGFVSPQKFDHIQLTQQEAIKNQKRVNCPKYYWALCNFTFDNSRKTRHGQCQQDRVEKICNIL